MSLPNSFISRNSDMSRAVRFSTEGIWARGIIKKWTAAEGLISWNASKVGVARMRRACRDGFAAILQKTHCDEEEVDEW
jgi:hypothetical protein